MEQAMTGQKTPTGDAGKALAAGSAASAGGRWAVAPSGAQVAFTDRSVGSLALHVGGDGAAVQRARRRLEDSLGVPEGSLLFLEQVHGVAVADAERQPFVPAGASPEQERELAPEADAAFTTAGRPLAVLTADCLPVVLTTEDRMTNAVAHAGRRGLLDGVLPAVVGRLRETGARHVTAWIGPAVCGACYEVPAEMAAEAERVLPGIAARTSWGTPSLDLAAAAEGVLVALDVTVERRLGACTLEEPLLYSHRRQPGEGRLAGVVTAGTVPPCGRNVS